MSARKDDAGKPPLSLIPRSALLAEARVMAKGKEKYGAHNWRNGMEWSRLVDAAMRHLLAFAAGENEDDGVGGSGESHLANARCCLAFLIEFQEKGLGNDDRFKHSHAPPDTPSHPTTPPESRRWRIDRWSDTKSAWVAGAFISGDLSEAHVEAKRLYPNNPIHLVPV